MIPQLTLRIREAEGRLIRLRANYFQPLTAQWKAKEKAGKTDPAGKSSKQYVLGLCTFLDREIAQWRELRTPTGQFEHNDEVLRAATLSRHELDEWLAKLNYCEQHFHAVKRRHACRERMLKQPCLGDIDVQLDFKENDSVPLAPEETQDMFWGSAHQAVTTLGFCVTHRKSTYPCNIETRYFYYCTYIRDHTQLFAAVALKDLLERLNVQAEWCHRLHVWADCGPHFCGYMFLWNL